MQCSVEDDPVYDVARNFHGLAEVDIVLEKTLRSGEDTQRRPNKLVVL